MNPNRKRGGVFQIYDELEYTEKMRSDPAPSGRHSKNRAILCKLQRAKSLHEQRGLQMYIQKEVATSDGLELVNYIEFGNSGANETCCLPKPMMTVLRPFATTPALAAPQLGPWTKHA